MKRSIIRLFIAGILVFSLLPWGKSLAQNNNPFFQKAHFTGLHNEQANVSDTGKSMNQLLSEATEDPAQRTEYSTGYKTDDGTVIYKYSTQPLNYYNDAHELVPIKISLKSSKDGWVADQQPNPCYLYSDRSTGISTGDGGIIKFNEDSRINGAMYQQQLVSMSENIVKFDMTPDIHKQISFLINGIKTDYTIDKPIGNDIEISEAVDFPEGVVLQADKKNGNMVNGMWRGEYKLVGADGVVLAKFGAPLCYDSKKNGFVGYYRDEYKNGKHILYTVVPSSWLKNASYPVTIDPTVMGPVSHWNTNKRIPSDLYPNFYTDSILVTIPGQITITRLYASFCFITNISNGIYYTYGRVYFKTPCSKTPILQCDSNASLPGYCYLDTLNNNNDFGPSSLLPLTCCFSPSCSAQTFYFGVGLARNCSCPPNAPDSTNWLWSPSIADGIPYPFYAYIVGKTDEATWSVSPTTVCSNKCSLNLSVTANYGVPPYTITHPWATGKTVIGTSKTCNSSTGTTTIPLTIPGCPAYCGSSKTLSVPPPVVYDVCNDTVKGLTAKSITVNPVPKITATPDSMDICSGTPVNVKISSCTSGTVINWTGTDKTSGTDSTIYDVPKDTTNNPINVNYTVYSTYKGCTGDTDHVYVKVSPTPTVSVSHDTTILEGASVSLSSSTNGTSYSWSPASGLSCTSCPDPIATPTATTVYYVTVTGADGCPNRDSVIIYVTPQAISIPNIFTPNGDKKNDIFYIHNLEYYPGSHLIIYDRWGKKVYESASYPNNWDGGGQSDGVYYYILTLPNSKKYDGYVQILK